MPNIAVIDIGKTNAKLALIATETGEQLSARSMRNAVLPGPPYPHADVDGLWHFICDGLSAFAKEQGVDAVSVTTHGATAALVGENDIALPVLDYEHAGPDELAQAYDALRPDFAEAFSPRLPSGLNLGAQIFWQARQFPQAFADVRAILAYPQYWTWRLTGVLASEATSLGCHTDLWDVAEGKLSSLVAGQGWSNLFPPLHPAASVLGPVLPEIADLTGLAPGTPVACGIHDSNASLLPWLHGITSPFTVISSGTWTILMTVGGNLVALDPARDCLANVDALGRPVPTARFMGGREFDMLVDGAAATPSDDAIIACLRDQIMALPAFVAGVGPFADKKGRWTHDPSTLDAANRCAAATLYLTLMTKTCLGLAGCGDTIVIEGPLARNAAYCRLLAALTGRSVHASPDATGTTLGAAMLFADKMKGAPQLGAPVESFKLDGLDAYAAAWLERASSGT